VVRRVAGDRRVFVVVGELVEGQSIGIDQVLTWPTLGDLTDFCDRSGKSSPKDGFIKKAVLGSQGSVIAGGMSVPFSTDPDRAQSWMVKLGDDRFVSAWRPGTVLTLLKQEWHPKEGTPLWTVYATRIGRITVIDSDKPDIADIPGV
jgi:hypothetical protein